MGTSMMERSLYVGWRWIIFGGIACVAVFWGRGYVSEWCSSPVSFVKERQNEVKTDPRPGGESRQVRSVVWNATNPDMKMVQQALKKAGYNPGQIDGIMGRRTRRALRGFQSAHGFPPKGTIDARTWAALSQYLSAPSKKSGKEG